MSSAPGRSARQSDLPRPGARLPVGPCGGCAVQTPWALRVPGDRGCADGGGTARPGRLGRGQTPGPVAHPRCLADRAGAGHARRAGVAAVGLLVAVSYTHLRAHETVL